MKNKIYLIENENNEGIYIGKTRKPLKSISELNVIYNKSELRDLLVKGERSKFKVTILDRENADWFRKKVNEIYKYHKSKDGNSKLTNAKFHLEGKMGYWEGTNGIWFGKKRDAHTIKRLSESKFKKVVQYDKDFNLVRIFTSAKEAAIEVLDDYELNDDNKGKSKIYTQLQARMSGKINTSGYYWFYITDFDENNPPKNIKKWVTSLRTKRLELNRKNISEARKKSNYKMPHKPVKKINFKTGEVIKVYKSAEQAAKYHKFSKDVIQKRCSYKSLNHISNTNYTFEYLNQEDRNKFIFRKEAFIKKQNGSLEDSKLKFNQKTKSVLSMTKFKRPIKIIKGHETLYRNSIGEYIKELKGQDIDIKAKKIYESIIKNEYIGDWKFEYVDFKDLCFILV